MSDKLTPVNAAHRIIATAEIRDSSPDYPLNIRSGAEMDLRNLKETHGEDIAKALIEANDQIHNLKRALVADDLSGGKITWNEFVTMLNYSMAYSPLNLKEVMEKMIHMRDQKIIADKNIKAMTKLLREINAYLSVAIHVPLEDMELCQKRIGSVFRKMGEPL